MANYTITIQREFGSMGRTIARKVADRLGIKFYDRDIVEKVSSMLNLPVSTVSNKEENAKYGLIPFIRKFPLGTDDEYMQDMIFSVQRDVILDLAKKENCIIVGRCSDAILEKKPDNLNIYIYAPYKKRLENCVNYLEMTPQEAKHMIASVDKARIAYHKKYAGFLPSDEKHHDLMINSAIMDLDYIAEMIVFAAEKKFNISEHPEIRI